MSTHTLSIPLAGQTLAAVLRQVAGPLSWAEARSLVASRCVRVNGGVCLDDARRLKQGETIEISDRPVASVERDVRIVFSDADVVVVDKPAGIQTVRRIEECDWNEERKRRQPTLDEVVQGMLTPHRRQPPMKKSAPIASSLRVRAVHRLDRDTSGLMMFALSMPAEQELIRRFSKHEITRIYRAVVHGNLAAPKAIETWLLRDRGDGVRGSVTGQSRPTDSQHAVTHVQPIEHFGNGYTLVECELETGRTHQIRIHLTEIGHMICGEKVYASPKAGKAPVEDHSGAPRQALHSAVLQFEHPVTGKNMRFESGWPKDMTRWIEESKYL